MRSARTRVFYVYHGTAGVAGAYAHGVATALSQAPDVECDLAVNWYYAFREAASNVRVRRLFFRLSENTDRNPFLRLPGARVARLPIRYLELAAGYARALVGIVGRNVDVVNLSVIDDELPTLGFAWAVKALRRRLHVTAHDAVFQGERSSEKRRRRTFELADRVVVHSPHVQRELETRLGVPAGKITVHPFPWAEVRDVLDQEKLAAQRVRFRSMVGGRRRVFLLPGILRPEKGIDTLLRAWRQAELGPRCLLVIAGKPTAGVDVASAAQGMSDVLLLDHYLTNEELWALLELADVVVLPYSVEWYAHSSMVLMALQASKPVVVSEIPLFRGLVCSGAGYFHRPADPEHLAQALRAAAAASADELKSRGAAGRMWAERLWADLGPEVAEQYR